MNGIRMNSLSYNISTISNPMKKLNTKKTKKFKKKKQNGAN